MNNWCNEFEQSRLDNDCQKKECFYCTTETSCLKTIKYTSLAFGDSVYTHLDTMPCSLWTHVETETIPGTSQTGSVYI